MKSVFITRKIPDIGIALLQNKGYEIDINPHDRSLNKKELISYLHNKHYDAVITVLSDQIDSEIYSSAPSVKIFANYATGFDNFDLEEGKSRGIYLSNVPDVSANRVAEFTWSLILALSCRIIEANNFLREGNFNGWNPTLLNGIKVLGKTLGIVGLGSIGSEVARIGIKGFGMRVIYNDIKRNNFLESNCGLIHVPLLEDIFRQSDFVSVHVPLNDGTHHLIGIEQLASMKSSAFIINTSRGSVIDEKALISVLSQKKIAGAGLDVYENEKLISDDLKKLNNVILTPHIASSTLEVREEMIKIVINNIIDVLEGGKPRNLIYN